MKRFIPFLLFVLNFAHADDEIFNWVKQNRKQTTQSFKAYHWASRGGKDLGLRPNLDEAFSARRKNDSGEKSEDAPLEITPPEALTYFKKMTGMFYKGREQQTWAVGDGLYAAFDPLQSIMYAGKRWLLLEITVHRPIYYLDVHTDREFMVLKDRKFGRRDLMSSGRIKKQFARALKANEISVLRYNWDRAAFTGCGKRKEAYSFIRPELLHEGIELKVFVENIPVDSKAIAEYERVGQKISSLLTLTNRGLDDYLKKDSPFRLWLEGILPQGPTLNEEELKAESFECLYPLAV